MSRNGPIDDFATTLVALSDGFARNVDEQAVTLRLADTVACAIGAERLAIEGDNVVARVARLPNGVSGSDATIWFSGERSTLDHAAFRNAVAARYLDMNDTYVGRTIIHPSDALAALVAMAECRAVPWRRLYEAIAVTYEIHCRLADGADLRAHGFDASSLTPIAVAAGAAWLLDLSSGRQAVAVRLAALDSGMLRCIRLGHLSDWKTLASARGAAKAVFAVQMAELGSGAPDVAFEGREGYFERVSGPLALETNGEARMPRTIIKLHPAQVFVQALIDAAAAMSADLPPIDHIVRIDVRTYKLAVELVGQAFAPGLDRETADHCAAFCVAAVLIHGHLDYATQLADLSVQDLAGKVALNERPADTAAFPRELPAEICVVLADGRELKHATRGPASVGSKALAAKIEALMPPEHRRWPWRLPGRAPEFPSFLAIASRLPA